MQKLIADGRCSILQGVGYLYMYVFHGLNTWGESHHTRIVRITAMDAGRLAERFDVLANATNDMKLGRRLTVRSWLDEVVGTVE